MDWKVLLLSLTLPSLSATCSSSLYIFVTVPCEDTIFAAPPFLSTLWPPMSLEIVLCLLAEA